MDVPGPERRLAAVLAADMVGFSRLMEVDEAGTLARLKTHRIELIDPAIAKNHGRIIKTTGDGLLVEFHSVVDAVVCAAEIQGRMGRRNADVPPPRWIQFRIGINLGDVIVDQNDIFGDGVNVAARLEALAEPGGICISSAVRDQLGERLDGVAFEDIGEQSVKNIARSIRVYRIRLEDAPPVAPAGTTGAKATGKSRKPSIAVLPFANLSRDPSQDYFSDGVTEDLITGLSKISGLFVIARNSVFTYKGKPVKVRDVGRDLGVRYVVEGGVQRAGNRVRITAQLVDAGTGYHIWAERYDREVGDIFALQDEVTRQIIRAMSVKLTEAEQARIGQMPTGVVEAYDLVLHANEERKRTTRDSNAEARRLFVKAIDLDPAYAVAYVGLGWAHLQSWQFLWSTDRQTLARAKELADRAIALDRTLANAYHLLGQVYLWEKEHERALAQIERAIELAPNDADGFETLAEIHNWSGTPEQAIRNIRHAMRLNPRYPYFYLWTLGHAYYLVQRRQEALDVFGKLIVENPNFVPAHAYRAVILSELGRVDEAQKAWNKAGDLSPAATVANIRERLPYKRQSDLDRFLAAARHAGMQ